MSTKVVGYVRVSQVRGREGDSFISPELQREQIEAVARREGLTVVEVIEELDKSGGDSKRPGCNRALELVESGAVRGIACWNLSRFSRSLKDALVALERVEAAGGQVYSAAEQWAGDSAGNFARNVLLTVAQMERERAAEGFRAVKASAIERGIDMRIPLGYARDENRRLVPDPGTAPVVQGAFERKARGDSVQSIVRWMRDEGVEFTDTGVRYMLSNRAYRGEAHAGDLVNPAAHPALVTEALLRGARGGAPRASGQGGWQGSTCSAGSPGAPTAGAASGSPQAGGRGARSTTADGTTVGSAATPGPRNWTRSS